MADLGLARRMGAALWFFGGLIAVLLLPLAPPTESSAGDLGWVFGIGIVGFAFGYAARLLLADVGPNEILALDYVAVVLIAVMMWLSGEPSPYAELLLLAAIYTAAVHPPRRTFVFLVAMVAGLASPAIYSDDQTLASVLAHALIWSGLAIAATLFTARVRLERARLLAREGEARTEARKDPLTGLGNRRAFDEAMAAATGSSDRTGTALSVILADVDSFKVINDRYGLPAGDRCLNEVAGVMSGAVRGPDACFRWGGDEFAIVADVDRSGASRLAARIGDDVRRRCGRPTGDRVRLHVGIAELNVDGGDPAELLVAASRMLKPMGEG
jgi:diguanylate cyclase (GGDEF)-like protein